MELSLQQRVKRFLWREEDCERRSHDETAAMPADLRELEGVCIQQARLVAIDSGLFSFAVADNKSKFRRGDSIKACVDDGGEVADGADGAPLVYRSYDATTGLLRLERDNYDRGPFELTLGATYVLDRRPLGLQGRLVAAIDAAFEEPRLCRLLDGSLAVEFDGGRLERARRRLAGSGLNEAQVEAGSRAIATSSLALVQGPPGTGKTKLLAQVVAALVQAGCRVALCAFTNRAVDHALLAIREAAPESSLVRLRSDGMAVDQLAAARVQVMDARRANLPKAGVVAGTCYQLARLPAEEGFHYTVFDEAGQMPIPHAMPGLLRGGRWLLFGDHQQLAPVVQGDHADAEMSASVFAYLAARYGTMLLDTTYRLNRGVCALVSGTFYGGRVHSDPAAAERRMPFRPGGRMDEVLDPAHAVVWLRVDHRQPGQRSVEEANAAADVVGDLVRQHGVPPRDIALIAPFRSQGRLLRSALQQRGIDEQHELTVDTVERIQGQEREVVVISMAVGDPHDLGHRGSFFFSPNRLNVAISRARSKVVIVASDAVFTAVPDEVEALRFSSQLRALRSLLHEVDLTKVYASVSSGLRSVTM